MIDSGSSAAHAGARKRARPGKGLARGSRTRAPSRREAGTPESALCKLKLTMDDRILCSSGERARRTAAPEGLKRPPEDTKWISQIARGRTALEFPANNH
jgi:hypothetical protein